MIRCPNDCSAYVQRKLLETHLQACPRSTPTAFEEEEEEEVEEEKEEGEKEEEEEDDIPDSIETDDLGSAKTLHPPPVTEGNLNLLDERLMQLEQDINIVRSALNEEARQRHRLIIDVGTLRKRNVIADEWTLKVGEVLTALKKCVNEETESRCIDVQQAKVDIGRLVLQYQVITSIRVGVWDRLDKA